MITYCKSNLEEIKNLLTNLENKKFTSPLSFLSESTIGQHVRHILEFYQCLILAQKNELVNYDNRPRNLRIETDINYAIIQIDIIIEKLKTYSETKFLILEGNFTSGVGSLTKISTTFQRELAYCLEHSIHHQALIKVGLKELNLENIIEKNFGVAPATIRYHEKCVQ